MVLQNGSIKRFVVVFKFSDGGTLNWEDDWDLILLGYRSSIQSSTLYSPFELVYGVKARLPIELDLPMHTYQGDEGIDSRSVESWESYLLNMNKYGTWGTHLELQALSNMLSVTFGLVTNSSVDEQSKQNNIYDCGVFVCKVIIYM